MATYPAIKRENDHSNDVALQGLSSVEAAQLLQLLQRVRSNVEKDWEWVKKGNRRDY
jgi:hypothetical protein